MAIVSKLATLRMFSPCHSGKRTHAIDTITPHCVVGQMSADSLGHLFQDKTRQASCNYAIGFDGTIICIVPEEYRIPTTSGRLRLSAQATRHPHTHLMKRYGRAS